MKLIEKKDNQIIFKAEIDESLANTIRRYVYQVPVLAIDEIEISKNDSPLYDETIAHRLGLVPLDNEKLGGQKTATLKLSSKKEGFVTSGELTGSIKPVFDKIPITSLNKGQELDLVATAKLGIGSNHSKFSPGLIIYRNVVDIKIDKDCPLEISEICPLKVLSPHGGKIKVDDPLLCDMCNACVEYSKKQGKEYVRIDPTKELLITIESFGQLSCEEMFTKTIEALKKDLAEVSKKIK
ncbi:MAG: DNA-directed RNA polymerase subunit D [archaeon]